MTFDALQRTGAALVEFKSFFPSKTLQKGLPLEVYYSARDRTALFQIRVRRRSSLQLSGIASFLDACTALLAPVFER